MPGKPSRVSAPPSGAWSCSMRLTRSVSALRAPVARGIRTPARIGGEVVALVVWALAALTALNAPALAVGIPPPDARATVGRVIDVDGFVDQTGSPFAPATGDARPWIVCPIYTRCPTTCSALTAGLKTALRESGLRDSEYRVLVLSFDPSETDGSLRAFRERMQIPPAWFTVRAAGPAALERALTGLDFRTIALDGGGFEHPNLVAVLDAGRRVSGYVYGVVPSPTELARAVASARDGAPTGERWLPYLFVFGLLAFLASAAVFIATLGRTRRYGARRAAPADASD
jgi:cytochrome oxidase Cu insertion factor (SCO1/SenC/PrrC family)